jgi:signal transduction histidine kinase
VEAVRALRQHDPELAIVTATELASWEVGVHALAAGADDSVSLRGSGRDACDRALWYSLERRRAHRHIEQNHRLASVGQMAAGLAHEINNPASYVIGNLELMRELLVDRLEGEPPPAQGEIAEMIDECLDGIRRIWATVRDLQAFARVGSEALEDVDMAAVVRTVCEMARKTVDLGASIQIDVGSLPPIRGDRGKLCQALLGLLTNAADAVASEDSTGGIILRADVGYAEVIIDVIARGHAIPGRERRMFEPFYGAQPGGAASGLGLSIAAEIIRRHGGRIDVDNEPGRGSKFSVRLPVRR